MENITVAIGNTLINSLWQGVLLAVVTALIILTTRRVNAAQRYRLLVGALLLFAVSAATTFCYELQHVAVKTTEPIRQNSAYTFHTKVITKHVQDSVPLQIKHYVNAHTQTIVWIWFMIVTARCLQLAMGLHNLSFLRRKNLLPVDEAWAKRVAALAEQLGIKRVVGIAGSAMVKVPMVIGHLKPLILIPAGLLTALSPAEIEAILIHELAHIQRKDYLVNLLQSLLEIIFFFNPAVLWLLALIRAERENCCDDMAVDLTSSKVDYIRALVTCHEYRMTSPDFAMAFPGARGGLVDRVKRMASGRNHALNVRDRFILFIMLLTAGLVTAAFSGSQEIKEFTANTRQAITKVVVPVTDTVPLKPLHVVAKPKVKVTAKTSTKVNINAQVARHKAMAYADSVRQNRLFPVEPVTTRTSPLSPISSKLSPIATVSVSAKPADAVKSKTPDIGDQVTAELIRDGIISADDKHVSFKLSNTELIVNGVKQPDNVQQRYRQKYVPDQKGKKGTWTLMNNYDTSTEVH